MSATPARLRSVSCSRPCSSCSRRACDGVDTAFTIAKVSGLGLIGFYGYWAARFAGNAVLRALVQAASWWPLGAVVIALKALVH